MSQNFLNANTFQLFHFLFHCSLSKLSWWICWYHHCKANSSWLLIDLLMSLWIILLSLRFQIVFSEIIYECKMKSFWWKIECFLFMDEVVGFKNIPGLIKSWWNYQNSLICLNLRHSERQLHNPPQDISLKSSNIVFKDIC